MKINKFLLLILLFCSCSSDKNPKNKIKIIEVPTKEAENKILVSEIVSNVEYLKLEKSTLLGTIKNCKILDKIYCLSSNKIDVFDLQGKFLFEINHFQKEGPEGYMDLSHFEIDTSKNLIEIWDRYRRRIVSYNLNNGSYQKGQFFKVNAFSFVKYDENYFFYSGYQPNPHLTNNKNIFHIFQFNENGKFLKFFLEEKEKNRMTPLSSKPAFTKYENILYFNPGAKSTIYKYHNDNFSPSYFINFGNNALPNNHFKDKERWYVRDLLLSKYMFLSRSFIEYDFGFTFCYSKSLDKEYRAFSKKNFRRLYVSLNNGFINDFDGNWPITMQFIQNDLFVTCYDAFMLKEIYYNLKRSIPESEWVYFIKKHNKFCSLCENLKETDNPVLVLMTPKKI